MKIFYFFQELPTNMYYWQRVHIINELERHNVVVKTFNPLCFETMEQANEETIKEIKKDKYDLFFTNVCYEKVLYPSTIESIKSLGIPTLCLRCDNLVIPYNDKKLAPYFDLVWLTAIETKSLYDRWGVKSFFAPYAANPFVFNPSTTSQHDRKVCFIGTPYGSRSIMINLLSSNGIPVDVYYKKTNNGDLNRKDDCQIKSGILSPNRYTVLYRRLLFPEGRKMMYGMILNRLAGQSSILENENLQSLPIVLPENQSKIYSSCTLSLASTSTNHTDVLKNPLKIVNLRNFEIPMSGGIEICKFNPELANYFEEGKEIVFYREDEELVEKSRFYLNTASDQLISDLKEAARKRAAGEHTWWNRFTKAFDILGLSY